MFGGQDDKAAAPPAAGGAGDDTLSGVADLVGGTATPVAGDPVIGAPAASDSETGMLPSPSEPPQTSLPAPTEEAEDVVAPVAAVDPVTITPASGSPVAGGGDDVLLDLKQQAMQELNPLLDHLEQSPEDEFRTTMMMIQASDNKALLEKAYAAAQKITDGKAKAHAILDVINEINYFTQKQE